MPKDTNKPTVTTRTSNPYAALAACLRAARWAGWTEKQIRELREKATSGTLADIIPTLQERFELI